MSELQIRFAHSGDTEIFERVAAGVFDNPIRPELLSEFLSDPRHHIVVGIIDDTIVGFVSGVDYIHPDKPREMWLNEVGVGDIYRGQGIATRLLTAMLEESKRLGCTMAWLGTERTNIPAMKLYTRLGGVEALEQPVYFEFEF